VIPVKNESIDTSLRSAKRTSGLKNFPDSEFTGIIKELGFKCELCARCCTKSLTTCVFADSDLERIRSIDPDAVTPLLIRVLRSGRQVNVSGYAENKTDGSCIFLRTGCKIIEPPSICRVYPHMLHREADETGKWTGGR
jgi:Fe-S-cluster containining protein